MIENIDGCNNNPEKSSTTIVDEHIPSGLSISTISSFKDIKNNHDVYRGKDCMKKLCEWTAEIIWKCKNLLYLQRKFKNMLKINNIIKLVTIVIMMVNIEVLHTLYVI